VHVQDGASSAASNLQDEKYPPHVHLDGRVTFRFKAPMAQRVQIEPVNGQPENNGYNGLGKAPYDMTRDEHGLWTVTTPPAVPGLHAYWLVVDGVRVNDTATKSYGGRAKACGVEVPEPGVDFYDIKDVPHGQVRMQWYYSKVTEAWRRAFVYTPPDYDDNREQRYPVFILRHGGGEDETSWVEQGRANFIVDNLIAEGKAKPMIVVMDWGQAPTPGQPLLHIPSTPPPPEMTQVTVKELIPMVDATFRTIPDREHRAMAGLSMGSVQTLYIGLTNLDTFSYLGIFSRRPMSAAEFNVAQSFGGVFTDAAAFKQQVRLFWWGAGTAEEGIYNATKADLAELAKAGIESVFVEFPGTSHEWQTWRKSLYDFAPRLFRR